MSEKSKFIDKYHQTFEFLNIVVNSLADPVFVKDEKHRWILLNDAMVEMIGIPREDLIGKSDYDVHPKEEADLFWAQDIKVLASDHPIENEESHTGADGKQRIVTTSKVAKELPNGEKII